MAVFTILYGNYYPPRGFGWLNQNVLWNQPNTVNQTILLDEPFFSECEVVFFSVIHSLGRIMTTTTTTEIKNWANEAFL